MKKILILLLVLLLSGCIKQEDRIDVIDGYKLCYVFKDEHIFCKKSLGEVDLFTQEEYDFFINISAEEMQKYNSELKIMKVIIELKEQMESDN